MWWLVSLARAPAARIDGATLVLSFGGVGYALSQSKVFTKPSVELHFEQPYDQGYNQLWLVVGKVKPGRPSTLEGYGMGVAFVSSTRNVSASCGTKGTVTFDAKPKPGATASGQIDVVLTCDDVPELSGPIAIRGGSPGSRSRSRPPSRPIRAGAPNGGELEIGYGEVTIVDTSVVGNTAGDGGGVFANADRLRLEDCVVTDSVAARGGGFDLQGELAEIVRTTVLRNTASLGGGGAAGRGGPRERSPSTSAG